MGAFFKTSCAVFWIIWMSASASLFGFEHMQQMYTYEGKEDRVSILIAAACGLTILMAIIGCCCVKTDASNICCAFFYLMGFSLPIFLLCVVLLISVQQRQSHQNEIDILMRTKRLYDASGTIPRFLHNTQVQFKCCGLYGFKDFRAFVLLNDDKMKEDVPFSCCKNQSGFSMGKCNPVEAGPNPIENVFDRTGLKIPFPLPKTGSKNFTYRYELYGPTGRCGGKACLAKNLLLYGDPQKVASIHTEGCYEPLKKSTENLHSSFSQFSIFLMACVILMAVLFAQNCLKARKRIKNPEDPMEQAKEALGAALSEKFTEEMLISELAQTEARRDSLNHPPGPQIYQPNLIRVSTDTTASTNIRRF